MTDYKWEKGIMPDDAPELAGSLVGSMLGVKPANPKPTSNDCQIRSSKIEPLCKVMADAWWDSNEDFVGAMADALDVVCDWLLPNEVEPVDLVRDQSRTASTAWQRWDERMDLRNRLTEQARIARGEQ